MIRFTVNLLQDERQALILLAQEERRDPRDQAALIIRQDLERRGLLQCGDADADRPGLGVNDDHAKN